MDLKSEIKIASYSFVSVFLASQALAFVSFPIQAIMKSSKIISILIVSLVLGSKQKFAKSQYLCGFLITAGIVLFNVSDVNIFFLDFFLIPLIRIKEVSMEVEIVQPVLLVLLPWLSHCSVMVFLVSHRMKSRKNASQALGILWKVLTSGEASSAYLLLLSVVNSWASLSLLKLTPLS